MRTQVQALFLIPALLLLTALPAFAQDVVLAPSHCTPDEQTVFSCLTGSKGKVLSVCSSPDLYSEDAWLQYRFGRPGQVEMAYPQDLTAAMKAFDLEAYTRPLVSFARLHFSNKGVGYTVFDDYYAEDGTEEMDAGVRVTLEDGREVVVSCKPPWSSSLLDLTEVVAPAGQ